MGDDIRKDLNIKSIMSSFVLFFYKKGVLARSSATGLG